MQLKKVTWIAVSVLGLVALLFFSSAPAVEKADDEAPPIVKETDLEKGDDFEGAFKPLGGGETNLVVPDLRFQHVHDDGTICVYVIRGEDGVYYHFAAGATEPTKTGLTLYGSGKVGGYAGTVYKAANGKHYYFFSSKPIGRRAGTYLYAVFTSRDPDRLWERIVTHTWTMGVPFKQGK
jgi:hypothetical protein